NNLLSSAAERWAWFKHTMASATATTLESKPSKALVLHGAKDLRLVGSRSAVSASSFFFNCLDSPANKTRNPVKLPLPQDQKCKSPFEPPASVAPISITTTTAAMATLSCASPWPWATSPPAS
ncbi:hypothetical protein T310_8647, partial [Rasamsonia emersonii CBS 393.64]